MRRHGIYLALICVFFLAALGLVMLSSTGAFAKDSRGDMYFFVKRQSVWLAVGICVCVFAALTDYHWWKRTWWVCFAGAIALLALCFIPPIGMNINGSNRWINLGFMAFQPSELAKVAAIFFLAWWYSRFEDKTKTILMGFFAPLAVVGVLCALILMEVDLGATALIGATAFAIMFIAGANPFLLTALVGCGLGGLIAVAMSIPERMARLAAFLDPQKYRLDEGLQQWQALIAFGSGGLYGLGLGEGRQKMLYLPYAHTDFIFPMIGEELGAFFTLLVVSFYLFICLIGFIVANNAEDRFGTLLAFGATFIITMQAAINIGVTTSILPNKGMPLPFISYGGSNLVICFFMIGLLISVHRKGRPVEPPPLRGIPKTRKRLAVRL
ncbi:MAG: putative lipid II flippase FtsW [Chthoniobacterales bacterium]